MRKPLMLRMRLSMLPFLLLLLLVMAAFTRSAVSLGGFSALTSNKKNATMTTTTTTTYPMVVKILLRRSNQQASNQQQQHVFGKFFQQGGLDVLGAKLVLRSQEEKGDCEHHDEDCIRIHILLHDDDDRQVLTNLLLLAAKEVVDYQVVIDDVPNKEPNDREESTQAKPQQSLRNLQQQTTKQQQNNKNLNYETIDQNRFKCYRTVEGTLATLQDLATAASSSNVSTTTNTKLAVTVVDIGQSYEQSVATGGGGGSSQAKGYPIRALRITAPSNKKRRMKKPQVLLTAGLHAREYAPPELLTRLAETLMAGYGVDADISWILNRTVIHILPLLNPDGRKMAEDESSPAWRKNTHVYPGCAGPPTGRSYGVDLNRQFPFAWGDDSGSSGQPCSTRTFRFVL
jgi:Zinc carboxypeptidase